MSNVMDPTNGHENGPVTPTNRSRSTTGTINTNPFNTNDMIRCQNHPYVGYADSRSGSQTNEDGDDSNVIYVSGIVSTIEDVTLYEMFSQFGQVVDILRRQVGFETKPNGIQQYAFVRFASVEDAQRALQVGEAILGDRKLTIKPRERRPRRFFPREDSGYGKYSESNERILNAIRGTGRPDSGKEHTFEHHYQDHNGTQNGVSAVTHEQAGSYDPSVAPSTGMRSTDDNGDASRTPMLMSKALFVAGLPFDMSPKELFMLFAEQGPVEGCYIFPFLDPFGRRFGHMVMATFFAAQKAQEAFDKCTVRNCVLEVGYRHLDPMMNVPDFGPQHPGFQAPPTPSYPVYCPTAPHQSWAQHPFMSQIPTASGIASQMMGFNQPYIQFSPGHVPTTPYGHQQMHMMAPPGLEQSYAQYGTPPNSPPFNSHPFGWQAQGRGVARSFQGSNGRHFARRPSYRTTTSSFTPSSPGTGSGDPRVRSISDSSSGTLVSGASEQKAHGPVIVNGSYPFTRCGTPQRERSLKGETSPSDEQSTPSPVVVRSAPMPLHESETPTKSGAKPPFQAIVPEAVPETPKPADPANLFVKNFDDDIIADPEDLKKLFESYGPVASSHLAMIPGTNRTIGYGFVAFTKAEDAANAKLKLNGSMIGKKRLFVSYAERKEERTQRLKLHFKKGRNSLRNDGNEQQDSGNSDTVQVGPSNNGNEVGFEGAGKGAKEANIKKELLVQVPDITVGCHETRSGQETTGDSLEASQTDESGERKSPDAVVATTEERSPLALVENIPHILAEQETAATTRWRGRTQLTGITEVEEEEALSPTALPIAVNDTPFVEAGVPQSHDHVLDSVSGHVQASDFQETKEQRNQAGFAQPDLPNDLLRAPGGNNNYHRHQNYDNRSPSPHNGNRGHGGQFYNYGHNGNGRGFPRYQNPNGAFGRGGHRFSGNNRPGGNGGYQAFNNVSSGPRTAYFNNSSQPFSTESSHEATGSQGQHRKKKWQNGNRTGRGGQQQRGSGAAIDHHTVNNMMLDVSDTGQGAVTAY